LFRQARFNDWTTVMKDVATSLRVEAARRAIG
jgi:hypothetical protein